MKSVDPYPKQLLFIWGVFILYTAATLYLNPQKLLDAPYVSYLGVISFLTIFYRPLVSLISRSNMTIKWGDKQISLQDIEGSVDEEMGQIQSALSDLSEEIDRLKNNAPQLVQPACSETRYGELPEAANSLVYALIHSKYFWRAQKTLESLTGMSGEEIDEYVKAYPEIFIRSTAKSGNVIYRLDKKKKLEWENR